MGTQWQLKLQRKLPAGEALFQDKNHAAIKTAEDRGGTPGIFTLPFFAFTSTFLLLHFITQIQWEARE
jgi:hypothetical protein